MQLESLESRSLLSATLTSGVSVTTGIRTAGVQKNYSINLKAGQSFVVAAGDNSAAFTTEVILIGTTGKALARSSGADGGFIGKVIPVTGTYRVRVIDVTNTHTASVTLTAFFTGATTIADSDDGGTAQSGRRFAASISPGDLDVWAIPASKNQFLSVVANENSNGSSVGVGVLLVTPDGTGVISKESDSGIIIDQTTKQAGTYYAVVYEPGANASGRYGFSIALAPGAQTTEDPDTQSPLVSGTPRNGDLPSGDVDEFQVSIASGQTTTISTVRTGGNTTDQVLLVDPTGAVVSTSTLTNSGANSTLTYTAKFSGTYSIVTRNMTPDTGGAYRLTYTLA